MLATFSATEASITAARHMAHTASAFGRLLFVAFTIRRSLVRGISARHMKRAEVDIYAKSEKASNS